MTDTLTDIWADRRVRIGYETAEELQELGLNRYPAKLSILMALHKTDHRIFCILPTVFYRVSVRFQIASRT